MNNNDWDFILWVASYISRKLLRVVLALCTVIFIVAMSVSIYNDRGKVKTFMEYQATMEEMQ